MGLPTARYRAFLDAAAGVAGLPYWERPDALVPPGTWLEGLVLTESSGNPKARRYEPDQDRNAGPDTPLVDDGELKDDASSSAHARPRSTRSSVALPRKVCPEEMVG